MNVALAAASALCAIGVFWHAIGGEIGIVRRLDPDKLASSFFGDGDITKRFLRACWHLFTVYLAVTSWGLFVLARDPESAARGMLARGVAIEFALFLVVYVLVAAPRPQVFLRAPQWIFFVAIAVFCWMGAG